MVPDTANMLAERIGGLKVKIRCYSGMGYKLNISE